MLRVERRRYGSAPDVSRGAYLRVPPEDVKLDGLLRRVMGDAPIGLPPRAIHFWKALVTRNISHADCMPVS